MFNIPSNVVGISFSHVVFGKAIGVLNGSSVVDIRGNTSHDHLATPEIWR
jgi:hypothetical protein